MHTVEIDADEWEAVAAVADHLGPLLSPRLPGVVLSSRAGRRRWTLTTRSLVVEVPGDAPLPGHGAAGLPVELVRAGSDLAQMQRSCALRVDRDAAVVVNDQGSVSARLLPTGSVEVAPRPRAGDHPGGFVAVDRLLELLVRGGRPPAGFDGSDAPPTVLEIADGVVSIRVEWARFGGEVVEAAVPATTSGSIAVAVPRRELVALLSAIEEEGDLRLVVDAGAGLAWMEGSDWSATVAIGASTGVVPLRADAVRRAVEEAAGGVVVEAALVGDTAVEVRRCAARAVHETPELLAEINRFNAQRSVRWWLVDGDLWAGAIGAVRGCGDVAGLVATVIRACEEIGPLLGMLGSRSCGAIPGQLALRWGAER